MMLDFSRPGKPIDNLFIDSVNGRFCDESLNGRWFVPQNDTQERLSNDYRC